MLTLSLISWAQALLPYGNGTLHLCCPQDCCSVGCWVNFTAQFAVFQPCESSEIVVNSLGNSLDEQLGLNIQGYQPVFEACYVYFLTRCLIKLSLSWFRERNSWQHWALRDYGSFSESSLEEGRQRSLLCRGKYVKYLQKMMNHCCLQVNSVLTEGVICIMLVCLTTFAWDQ